MEAIMTCQGHIADPQFSVTLKKLVSDLRKLVRGGIKVRKVEPWNSVRVTFSLGAEAAERLRLLATEDGGQILARLGILSVQVRSSELIVIRTGGGGMVAGGGQVIRDNEAGPSHRGLQPLPPSQQQIQIQPQQQLVVASGSQMLPVRPPHAPPPPYPGPGPMLVNLLQQQQQPSLAPEDPSPLTVQHSAPQQQSLLHYRLPQHQPSQQQLPLPPPQPNPSPPQPMLHQPSSSNPSVPSSSTNSSDVTSSGKTRQYLINPLTGVLEPMSSESSDEEDPVPPMRSPTPPPSPLPPLPAAQSQSNQPQAPSPTLCRLIQEDNNKPPPVVTNSTAQHSTGQQPNFHVPQSVTTTPDETAQQRAVDKLKLRLKLEKSSSGPFLYAPAAAAAAAAAASSPSTTTSNTTTASTTSVPSSSALSSTISNNLQQSTTTVPPTAEPRVPPLHISLRGRNAAVVTRFRDRKREGKTRKKVDSPPLERDNTSSIRELTSSVPPVPQPPPIPPQVSSYPSEAEVASILRSVPEVTTDEKKRKRSHPKSLTTPLRPQLEDKRRKVANSTAAVSSGASHQMNSSSSSGSFVKSLIKVLTKDCPRVVAPPPSSNNNSSGGNAGGGQQQMSSIVQPTLNDKKVDENDLCSVKGMPKKESPFISKPSPPTPLTSANSAPPPPNPPTTVVAQPTTTPCEAVKPVNDKAGEDSGIESMDALSEKSPNRGEEEGSGTGSDGSTAGNKKNGPREGDVIEGVEPGGRVENDLTEPDDPMPVRLTPALYTYSNPDKIKDGSGGGGSPLREDSNDRPPSMPMPRSTSRSRSNSASTPPSSTGGKSLLEQLLIEIPSANSSSDRGDLKNLNGPKSLSSKSLRLEDLTMNSSTGTPTPSQLVKHHRPRKPSESSSSSSPAILDDSTTPPLSSSSVSSNSSLSVNNITTRSKRKCSENATELIKACIGVNNAIDSVTGNNGGGTAIGGGAAGQVAAAAAIQGINPNNNNSIQSATPVTPTSQAPTIPIDDAMKIKKLTPSKNESSEDEDIKSGKDDDKNSKVVGRRSVRQEVKRTIHRKRQRTEEIVESKGRRRSSKEAK